MKIIQKFLVFIILLVFSLVPIIWFLGKGDILINGIDTNFPLDPELWFLRRLYVWNSVTNGGVDFSSSTAGLFFHFIQFIPNKLGLNLYITELFSLLFWFGITIFSSFFFAQQIIKRRVNQILFVALYCFNIYLFNSWENVKVANLSLVAGVPFILGLIVMRRDQKITYFKTAIFSVLLGLIISGTGINPAYFLTFFLTSFLFVVGLIIAEKNKMISFQLLKDYFLISLIIVLSNFFWILPTLNYILTSISPQNSIDIIGFTNWIDSLSENTSLLNVMRIQGAWDWYAFDSNTGLPLYIPYVLNYFYRIPFLIFSFLTPGLLLLSLIFKNKKFNYLYASFGIMFVVGIFLGAGSHEPSGAIFKYLYRHIPFFSLFRSPWYIFTPLVTVSMAGLISLLFDYLMERKFEKFNISASIITILSITLILANLVYCYPLITGKIYRPNREDSFFVKFPNYIFDAKKWLDVQPGGRVINYPEDEIEKFTWGYRGIESILSLLSNREMLFLPLNASDSPISKLVLEFYSDIQREQFESAYKIANKLDLTYIFQKNDQRSLSFPLPLNINKSDSVTFGKWKFYKISQNENLGKIYLANEIYLFDVKNSAASILTPIKDKDILVNEGDEVIKNKSEITKDAGLVVLAVNSQKEEVDNFLNSPSRLDSRLTHRDFSRVDYTFKIKRKSSYMPLLERYKLEEYGINIKDNLKGELDGKEVLLSLDSISNSYVYFRPFEFTKGTHKLTIFLTNDNLIQNGNFESLKTTELLREGESNILSENNNNYLRLINKSSRDIYVDYKLKNFDPLIPYVVQFKYRQIYGNNAQSLANQHNKDTLLKTSVESLPNYPDWQNVSYFFMPVKTKSIMSVSLLAPQTKDPLGTTVFYDDLEARKVFVNDLMFVRQSNKNFAANSEISFEKKSPALYEARIKNTKAPHVIIFSENYSPEWQAIIKSKNYKDVKAKPLHFSANLFANAWYIEGAPKDYTLEIYYKPQSLFLIGVVVSILTPSVLLFIRFNPFKNKHRSKGVKF